jgi:CHAT domain-containing protein
MPSAELLDLKPGAFRERRLRRYCGELSDALLGGLRPRLQEWSITRLAVSVPGHFSHVPFEALFEEGPEVFFVPSVRAAAAMAAALRPSRGSGRILAVGYEGQGLPYVAAEIERLRELYGDRLDLVSPRIAKRDLITRLTSTDYDLIHFACHGSFRLADESRSALHLSAVDDGRPVLLEAHELSMAQFPGSPVVVMSACESGLSSLGHSNNHDGLNGAFLRMGARGIIGSRWAVYDDAAFGFMDRFHTRVAAGTSTERAVAAAQSDMRSDCDVADWAAFFYLGLPGFEHEEGHDRTWQSK